jgi:hypothetical protein
MYCADIVFAVIPRLSKEVEDIFIEPILRRFQNISDPNGDRGREDGGEREAQTGREVHDERP